MGFKSVMGTVGTIAGDAARTMARNQGRVGFRKPSIVSDDPNEGGITGNMPRPWTIQKPGHLPGGPADPVDPVATSATKVIAGAGRGIKKGLGGLSKRMKRNSLGGTR